MRKSPLCPTWPCIVSGSSGAELVLLRQGNMHVHDLVPFPTKDFDFSHTIHKLTFGESYPGMKNPLDGITINQQGPRNPTGRPGMFQTFLRVRAALETAVSW